MADSDEDVLECVALASTLVPVTVLLPEGRCGQGVKRGLPLCPPPLTNVLQLHSTSDSNSQNTNPADTDTQSPHSCFAAWTSQPLEQVSPHTPLAAAAAVARQPSKQPSKQQARTGSPPQRHGFEPRRRLQPQRCSRGSESSKNCKVHGAGQTHDNLSFVTADEFFAAAALAPRTEREQEQDDSRWLGRDHLTPAASAVAPRGKRLRYTPSQLNHSAFDSAELNALIKLYQLTKGEPELMETMAPLLLPQRPLQQCAEFLQTTRFHGLWQETKRRRVKPPTKPAEAEEQSNALVLKAPQPLAPSAASVANITSPSPRAKRRVAGRAASVPQEVETDGGVNKARQEPGAAKASQPWGDQHTASKSRPGTQHARRNKRKACASNTGAKKYAAVGSQANKDRSVWSPKDSASRLKLLDMLLASPTGGQAQGNALGPDSDPNDSGPGENDDGTFTARMAY
eukprot:m.387702 g.387702  ORF g.387702 m.387702 type:complete len:456 (-) comp20066_c13_seq1:149-1516(-)